MTFKIGTKSKRQKTCFEFEIIQSSEKNCFQEQNKTETIASRLFWNQNELEKILLNIGKKSYFFSNMCYSWLTVPFPFWRYSSIKSSIQTHWKWKNLLLCFFHSLVRNSTVFCAVFYISFFWRRIFDKNGVSTGEIHFFGNLVQRYPQMKEEILMNKTMAMSLDKSNYANIVYIVTVVALFIILSIVGFFIYFSRRTIMNMSNHMSAQTRKQSAHFMRALIAQVWNFGYWKLDVSVWSSFLCTGSTAYCGLCVPNEIWLL